MKVSVILTSYNHEKYLAASIESVLNQTFADFELLIFDDGSQDSSQKIIKSYKDARIKLFLHEKNRGAVKCYLECVRAAKGKYIALQHSDDVWELDKLEKQVNFLEENPQYEVCFTQAKFIDESGEIYELPENHPYKNVFKQENRTRAQWLNYLFWRANCFCHPSLLIRNAKENFVMPTEFFQLPDYFMWVNLCRKKNIYVLPDELIKFRLRRETQNSVSSMSLEKSIRLSNELYFVAREFLPILREDLFFLEVFPEAAEFLIDGEISTDFAFAQLCLRKTAPAFQKLALEILYDLIHNEGTKNLIKKLYNYDEKTFIRDTGNFDVFGVKSQLQILNCRLYWEQGEKDSVKDFAIIRPDNNFSATFDFETEKEIQQLNFAPGGKAPLSIKIDKIVVNGEIAENFISNATQFVDDYYNFFNDDQIFTIDKKISASKVHVEISGGVKNDALQNFIEKYLEMNAEIKELNTDAPIEEETENSSAPSENFEAANLAKRLGIFCTYDSDGIIDDYIIYLLQEAKKILSYLVIVCNGKLTPEGREKLEKFADDIFVRENAGFDMEAWRQGILRHKENLKDYDEIILFNDSFYGPLYPFEKMFAEMYERHAEADFWGITIHGKTEDPENLCPYGYVPEHIQSYFLVVRQKLFHSAEFLNYWETAEVAQTFAEAIKKHEVCFTKNFYDKGFRYAVYCDTREFEKGFDIKFNPYVFFTEKLLKEQHCPIIKKRIFYFGRECYLNDVYGTAPRDCLKFVKENTNYDVSLIIKNILRKLNIATIKADLGLNYILSQNVPCNRQINLSEVALVVNLSHKDLFLKCAKYLRNVPKDIKLIIAVSSEGEKLLTEKFSAEVARNFEVRLIDSQSSELAALYVNCAELFKNFKYLGFIHDTKIIYPGEPVTTCAESFNLLWNNFLPSEIFIRNTLALFEEDLNLGVLVPPPPYHGRYRRSFFMGNLGSPENLYNKTLELAQTLNIPEKFLDRNFKSLTAGNVFWCRTAALKKITDKDWKIEDFVDEAADSALERILPFAAQAEGFYTGWLMTEKFAQQELENFIQISRETQVNLYNTSFLEPELMFHNFSALTNIQILKYFLQSRIPHEFWFFFKPFKNLLSKLGFKT